MKKIPLKNIYKWFTECLSGTDRLIVLRAVFISLQETHGPYVFISSPYVNSTRWLKILNIYIYKIISKTLPNDIPGTRGII